MKKIYYILFLLLIISCQKEKKEYSGNEPQITLNLTNNKGKEIIIYCPLKSKKQKIKAENGKHILDFEIGDLIIIYDSENPNYLLVDGSKEGSIKKVLKKKQSLNGDYKKDFQQLDFEKDKSDLTLDEYYNRIKIPYSKVYQPDSRIRFDYNLYKKGIQEIKLLNNKLFNKEISDDIKLNILFNSTEKKFYNEKEITNLISSKIDTLKVSKPLLKYFNERKIITNINFNIGEILTIDKLISKNQSETINLNKSKKEITILFFTAKWCGNCKRYIEPLKKILSKYSKNVEIIAINFDNNYKDYINYKKKLNVKSVSELVTMKNSINAKKFNIKALPNILIINSKKEVLLNKSQSDFIEWQVDGLINRVSKIKENKLNLLKNTSMKFIESMRQKNIIKSKESLSKEILSEIKDEQLEDLTSYFNHEVEFNYAKKRNVLNGRNFTNVYYKQYDSIFKKESLIFIEFNSLNKITRVRVY